MYTNVACHDVDQKVFITFATYEALPMPKKDGAQHIMAMIALPSVSKHSIETKHCVDLWSLEPGVASELSRPARLEICQKLFQWNKPPYHQVKTSVETK